MAISEWSDQILVANLSDEPSLSDDLAQLAERLDDLTCAADIVLDFQSVAFVNSSNMSQLLHLRQVATAAGGRVCLCGLNDSVRSVLEITRLDRLFEMQPDTATALALLQMAME
jgi:anti-anti-sigma factor